MAKRSGASKSFTVFAIVMALALVLGSLFVFGGAIFGSEPDDPLDEREEANRLIADLETQVAENPDDADSAANLANIYANQGNIAGAIPLYERATSQRPEDGNLRLSFGIALYRGGSTLDAQVQLERALELLPENASPAYYLGQLEQLRDEPDVEAARIWYERAIETDPESLVAEQARERLDELGASATPTP